MFCCLIFIFILFLIIYCFFYDCGKEMFIFNFEKNLNKMIEIYVVDERDLKYILIFMVCFVINYNNFCMFNLYFLSVIKNYDILLMVFEKKIIKLYIISLINSNI